jgi:hypothetical protein
VLIFSGFIYVQWILSLPFAFSASLTAGVFLMLLRRLPRLHHGSFSRLPGDEVLQSVSPCIADFLRHPFARGQCQKQLRVANVPPRCKCGLRVLGLGFWV